MPALQAGWEHTLRLVCGFLPNTKQMSMLVSRYLVDSFEMHSYSWRLSSQTDTTLAMSFSLLLRPLPTRLLHMLSSQS